MTMKDKDLESFEDDNPIAVVQKLIGRVCLMNVKCKPISLFP